MYIVDQQEAKANWTKLELIHNNTECKGEVHPKEACLTPRHVEEEDGCHHHEGLYSLSTTPNTCIPMLDTID